MCWAIPSSVKFISGIPHSFVICSANAFNSALDSGLLNLGTSSPHFLVANSPIFFLLDNNNNNNDNNIYPGSPLALAVFSGGLQIIIKIKN